MNGSKAPAHDPRPARKAPTPRFPADRRGGVALWVAMGIPVFLIAGGIALNVSSSMLARQGVQLAADLGAQAGAISYGRDVDPQRAATAAADVTEMNGVAPAGSGRSWNVGSQTLSSGTTSITIGAGITDPSRTSIAVTVAQPVPMAFAGLLGSGATRTVTANAVAEAWNLPPAGGAGGGSAPCVIATHPTKAMAIKVDNMGRIDNPSCAIVANSTSSGTSMNAAIYLNSGTLKGSSIGTPGKACLSNSGSNTVSPTIPNNGCIAPGTAPAADPFAGLAIPSPVQPAGCSVNATYGACCIPPITGTVSGVASTATNIVNKQYTSWQGSPRTFSPANGGVFCGNTSIGGNGTADQFAPGVYYVINGNLTFNNSNITSASGVSFVLLGRNGGNPGAISWTNYSNTYALTAPSAGPTANILFWQTCKADGTAPTNTMAGGSTLTMAGAFYAKCGALNMTNNIQMNAASGATFRVIANSIYVAGSAGINASTPAAAPSTADVALVR
jgi:Flp pilus assembly protein TadG